MTTSKTRRWSVILASLCLALLLPLLAFAGAKHTVEIAVAGCYT